MKELKQEIINLINSSIKVGDRFKAIKNEFDDDYYMDYYEDDICELVYIDYDDLNVPFKFKNTKNDNWFWLSLKNILDFEKIGE